MEEAIRKADALVEALPYIQQFHGKTVVIKFGGNAMETPTILDDVIEDVVFLSTVGIRTLVVHGGGPQISDAMERAGLTPRFIRGLRVTDEKTLDVVVRVLAKEINRRVVVSIEKHGGRAFPGFEGGHSVLRARKKVFRAVNEEGEEEQFDLGFVGEIVGVDHDRVAEVTGSGAVLAVPPIGQDETGQLYNVNADTAACAVAASVQAEKIVFLSNVHGIMSEPGNEDTLLSTANEVEIRDLIDRDIISGGMLPKVSACLQALDAGVRKAHIVDGRLPHSLLLEIFTDKGVGTQILRDAAPGAP